LESVSYDVEGLGHEEENQYEPRRLESLRGIRVTQMAVGRSHVLVVSDDGRVLSFGSGCYGKLGHGDQMMREFPAQVECLSHARVKAVFAGGNASFVLA
jgi:alpha-tubulin suppressor-like RCC1 family protein